MDKQKPTFIYTSALFVDISRPALIVLAEKPGKLQRTNNVVIGANVDSGIFETKDATFVPATSVKFPAFALS